MRQEISEMHAVLVSIFLVAVVNCTELTFELEDNAKQCFHEVIKKDTKSTLEFQVVTGGHYDVDVTLKDPNGKVLYEQKKKQYDSHQFKAEVEGEYIFCFSNEFSSFTHKTVYFDFQAGEEPPLTENMGKQHSALTQLETSASNMHEALKVVIDYQTHHRLRETSGREEAEYLCEYMFCFNNEFSSFSHKTVYFDFQDGSAPPVISNADMKQGALTQLETSTINIHEALKVIIDYQTRYKLRMSTGRSVAEYLFDRVKYWSLGQTVLIIGVSLGQVYMLRNFFAEKKENL